jgi:hypothetical protein
MAATNEACEIALAARLDTTLDAGRLPNLANLESEFAPKTPTANDVTIPPPDLASYNRLLPSTCEVRS